MQVIYKNQLILRKKMKTMQIQVLKISNRLNKMKKV